jgi:hypothetical protein
MPTGRLATNLAAMAPWGLRPEAAVNLADAVAAAA